jgi:hypothetical protein
MAELVSTLKSFLGTNELTTSVLVDAVSHLVTSLKDSKLPESEKAKLVLMTLLQQLSVASVPCVSTACLPLLYRLPSLPSLPSFFKKSSETVAPAAPAAPAAPRYRPSRATIERVLRRNRPGAGATLTPAMNE